MVVGSAPSILFPSLGQELHRHQTCYLPKGRTEDLLGWASRFSSRLQSLRGQRRRDLRVEVLVSQSEVRVMGSLEDVRRSRRQRWRAIMEMAEPGFDDVEAAMDMGEEEDETGVTSHLDSFFREMDLANKTKLKRGDAGDQSELPPKKRLRTL